MSSQLVGRERPVLSARAHSNPIITSNGYVIVVDQNAKAVAQNSVLSTSWITYVEPVISKPVKEREHVQIAATTVPI